MVPMRETDISLNERQQTMIDMLELQGSLKVETLASQFRVTAQTIRRDLNVLCREGRARRVYGGIARPALSHNQAYASRQYHHSIEKKRIAAEVARHIPNGVSLAFGIGTTPEMVARALSRHQGLRIFTNNLNVAMLVRDNKDFEVTIAGGRLRHDDCDVLGPGAEAMFSSYKVDIGIFGVAGVDEEGYLLDFREDEVSARQAIQQNSRQAFLALDHSKFFRNAHVRGGLLNSVEKVFCDCTPPEEILDHLRDSDTELIICR